MIDVFHYDHGGHKRNVEVVGDSVYLESDYPVPWIKEGDLPPIPVSQFEGWLEQYVDKFGPDKRYVFYNVWEPLMPLIPLDSLRGLKCTIIDNETLVWPTPDNVEHKPHPNQFLTMTIEHGSIIDDHCPTSHFSFVNAKYRKKRDRLWDMMERDNLLNENCSYIHRGIWLKNEEGTDHLSEHATPFLMKMPPVYPNVLIDVAVETEEEWRLRVTEKMWKPMYYKKLPLIYSSDGYYAKLGEMGFEFHDIVDWSFDSEPGHEERLQHLYAELKRLITIPLSNLERVTKEMREHNRKRCLEIVLETEKPESFHLPSQWQKNEEFDRMMLKAEAQYKEVSHEV